MGAFSQAQKNTAFIKTYSDVMSVDIPLSCGVFAGGESRMVYVNGPKDNRVFFSN